MFLALLIYSMKVVRITHESYSIGHTVWVIIWGENLLDLTEITISNPLLVLFTLLATTTQKYIPNELPSLPGNVNTLP